MRMGEGARERTGEHEWWRDWASERMGVKGLSEQGRDWAAE